MHVQTLSYDRQLKNPGKINQQKESMLETKSSTYLMNLKCKRIIIQVNVLLL